ncbi:MAG: hypothetical protein NZL87_05330, partial [Thermomicrobium sp.]|nr:hypothetical protein [Thermomicrobium sp.]
SLSPSRYRYSLLDPSLPNAESPATRGRRIAMIAIVVMRWRATSETLLVVSLSLLARERPVNPCQFPLHRIPAPERPR